MRIRPFFNAAHVALLAAVVAGCASAPPPIPPPSPPVSAPGRPPASVEAPAREPANPSGLNLRGFPVAFKEGYAAGCESGRAGNRRRDETRYKADMNYMMGWNDGYGICAGRNK